MQPLKYVISYIPRNCMSVISDLRIVYMTHYKHTMKKKVLYNKKNKVYESVM